MEKEIRDMAETRTAHYLKYFCEHEKYKYQCRECKGSQICVHNKRKPQCKECVGSQICSHDREKKTCRECGGSQICPHDRRKQTCKKCSDPIKITIKQWIFSRRQHDKIYNIYDADRFIDKCFLEGLIEDYKQCYYGDCKDADGHGPVNLQYTEYRNDLATIERLDNSIGHSRATVFCAVSNVIFRKSRMRIEDPPSSAHNLIYLS